LTKPTNRPADDDQQADSRAVTSTGRYRLSNRFIRVATIALLASMGVLVATGFTMGFLSDNVEGAASDALENAAVVVIMGGCILPVLIAAILGGKQPKPVPAFLASA
jgi:hypothetical protein